MFKYIFAAILLVIVWTVAILLREPFPEGFFLAIGITILTLLVLLGIVLYRRYRARRAARDIERALNAQAEEHARSVRPEQQAEIRAVQGEVLKAIQALKSSRLGRSGADALYALPWYVMIGPPGAGKTTALQNSGLQFPYLNREGKGSVKGVGGTRNCDWWLTNEGVLLDTAGRYTTQDDDRDEWLAFLDMLRTHRPRKPLNGLLVAVSVADLASAHDTEVERTARQIRERVDEVLTHLKMVLPVYVVFTKCDLIQGFVEYFGDLRKSDRGQIWGFTVPLEPPVSNPGTVFEQRFDELANVIEQRAVVRLNAEKQLEARENIYQFPQQFVSLRQNLKEFVDTLFAGGSQGPDAPLFRGVYFTSGTQEGRPIDRLLARMREAFNLPIATAAGAVAAPTEAKSYFLRDVFAKVVFPDTDIATRSAAEVRRERRRNLGIAAGALGLALLVSIFPTYSYLLNRDYVRETRTIVDRVGQHQPGSRTPLTLAELEPLRQRMQELRDDRLSAFMHFGMFTGDDLRRPVERFYGMALRRHVVEPIYREDVSDMTDFADRYRATTSSPTDDERGRFYDTLKLHLLLTAPRVAGEPPIQDNVRTWVTDHVKNRWARTLERNGANLSAADRQALTANSGAYVSLLARDENQRLRRNAAAVDGTRRVLNRTPFSEIQLNQLIATARERGFEDIDLAAAIGRPPQPEYLTQAGIAEARSVPGAFTRRAWNEYVRPQLRPETTSLVGEAWVLGQAQNTDEATRAENLRRLRCQYFERYINEWKTFLESMYVPDLNPTGRNSRDIEARALNMLRWFTEGDVPPYPFLFRVIAENTRLEEPEANAAANAAGRSAAASGRRAVTTFLRRQGRTGQAAAEALGATGQRPTPGTTLETCQEREDLEFAFRGLVNFGVPPAPPPAQAGANAPPPPPPAATPLDNYQEQLSSVRNQLVTVVGDDRADREALLTALNTARQRVDALVNQVAIGVGWWRPWLDRLLPPPVDWTTRATARAMAAGHGDRYCSTVFVPFMRTLSDRYPFNPAGHDAALGDIAAFYRPREGALWGYYGENLTRDVPQSGDRYEFVHRFGRSTEELYRDDLREFLDRSRDITTVMFGPTPPAGATPPAGGAAAPGEPLVWFDVRIRPSPTISDITFESDGQVIDYRNGPDQWHRIRWPGQDGATGAKIRVRGANGLDETIQQDGEWGLYRLFEAGQVTGSPEARIFTVMWRLRDLGIDVGVDVRPGRSENPFFGVPRRDGRASFLRPFRAEGVNAPPQITVRGDDCPMEGVPRRPRRARPPRSHRSRSRH